MTLYYSLPELSKIAAQVLTNTTEKVILFHGNMGTGKTTLIKELCKQLGVNDNISSPTYSIVNEYECASGIAYHFDFYRIEDEEEAYAIGFEEYLEQDAWVFIEWPSKIINLIPETHTSITLETIDHQQRKLTIDNHSSGNTTVI